MADSAVVALLLEVVRAPTLSLRMQEFPPERVRWIDAAAGRLRDEHWLEAEMVFGIPSPSQIAGASRLRWIQLPYAGVPAAVCESARRANIRVTNAAGTNHASVAEHALMLMLALARRLDVLFAQQQRRQWTTPIFPIARDLAGSTLGLVGLGRVGQGIARLAKAFGMEVVGCRRHAQPTPFVDRVFALTELFEMVALADWVVCALPLTSETAGLLGAPFFAHLKPGSRFINVSRGQVVDESALLQALDSGRPLSAALDVTAVEPLPMDSPLWGHPRVLLTPHQAATPIDASPAGFELFVRNLHRYLAGEPLENQVDLARGY